MSEILLATKKAQQEQQQQQRTANSDTNSSRKSLSPILNESICQEHSAELPCHTSKVLEDVVLSGSLLSDLAKPLCQQPLDPARRTRRFGSAPSPHASFHCDRWFAQQVSAQSFHASPAVKAAFRSSHQ